jgi:hypothetical protein
MFLVHFALIAGLIFFNGAQRRLIEKGKILLALPIWILFVYLISPTKFTFQLSTPGSGGWNIFGSFDDPLQFVANLSGLANPFTSEYDFATPLAWIVVFSIIPIAVSFSQSKSDLDESSNFMIAFFITVALAILIYMQYKSVETNFMLMKFLIGFSWIPYFYISKWVIASANFKGFAISLFLVFITFQFTQTVLMGAHYFNSSRAEIYLKSDADRFHNQFSKDQFCTTSSFMRRYELFLLNRENIFTGPNQWPNYASSESTINASSKCNILIIGNPNHYVEQAWTLNGFTSTYSNNGYEIYSSSD